MKPGPNQYRKNDISENSKSERLGDGIYFTPRLTVALEYARQCNADGNKFHVILQCRFKPEKVKLSDDYWLVRQSQDLRPYGIILVTPEQEQKIMKMNEDKLYSSTNFWFFGMFSSTSYKWQYGNWKDQYKKFRKYHGLSI